MTRGTNGSGSRRRRPPVPVAVLPLRSRVGPAGDGAAPSSAFLVLRRAAGRAAFATVPSAPSSSVFAFGFALDRRARGGGFTASPSAGVTTPTASVDSSASPAVAGFLPRPRPPRRLRRFAGDRGVPSTSEAVAEAAASDAAATSETSGTTDAAVAASDSEVAAADPEALVAFDPPPRPRPRPPRLRRRGAEGDEVPSTSDAVAEVAVSDAAATSETSGTTDAAVAASDADADAAAPEALAAFDPPPRPRPRPRPPRLRRRLGFGAAPVSVSPAPSGATSVFRSSFTTAPFALARGAGVTAGTEGSSDRVDAEACRGRRAAATSVPSCLMRGEFSGGSPGVPSRASSRTRNALVLAAASPIAAQPGRSPGAGVTGAAPSHSRSATGALRPALGGQTWQKLSRPLPDARYVGPGMSARSFRSALHPT